MFPSVQKLREAIIEYSVRNRIEIKMPKMIRLESELTVLKDVHGIFMLHLIVG